MYINRVLIAFVSVILVLSLTAMCVLWTDCQRLALVVAFLTLAAELAALLLAARKPPGSIASGS